MGPSLSATTWVSILLPMQIVATVLLVVLMSRGRIGPWYWAGEDGLYAWIEDETE